MSRKTGPEGTRRGNMQEPSEKEENVVLRDALRGGQSAEMLSFFFKAKTLTLLESGK